MATLYFHIPFCKRICTYCDFYKVGAVALIPRVVEVMHRELDQRHNYLSDKRLTSIYFGGGTPSLLSAEQIEGLIAHARQLFDCSAVEEITLEANPDDLTEEYINQLRATSINRISLGIQSFDDRVLQFMNRRHSAEEAVECVARLRSAGYDNISIDIIFGVAGFGDGWLEETLKRAISLGVEHISAYHLTVEENTRLGLLTRRGEYTPVDEERSEMEYLMVERMLAEAGYEHYEVSNYALEGRRARHNSAYWQGVEYLGIGPGAHSFNGTMRRWCEQRVEEYVDGVVYDSEVLTDADRFNEYVMTSLRCAEGISLDKVEQDFGSMKRERLEYKATQTEIAELLIRDNGNLRIAPENMLLSDMIIEALMEL